jgi:RNA polymerase sigma-70 factor (ECF subfamily)
VEFLKATPEATKSRHITYLVNFPDDPLVLSCNYASLVNEDQQLVLRAQNGEIDAFRDLVERHRTNVFRLAFDLTGNRTDAEDLSQDVFVKVFRSLKSFRSEAKFSTWLYRVTTNVCLDHRKKFMKDGKKIRPESIHDDDEREEQTHELPDHGPAPDRIAESGVLGLHIERALEKLSPRERTVFVMRQYHDLPLKQIAETLEISEGTVKSFLFRAIQRLQKELALFNPSAPHA